MSDPLADAMKREWRKRHDPDYDPDDRDAKSITDHIADAIRSGALDDVLLPALGFAEVDHRPADGIPRLSESLLSPVIAGAPLFLPEGMEMPKLYYRTEADR